MLVDIITAPMYIPLEFTVKTTLLAYNRWNKYLTEFIFMTIVFFWNILAAILMLGFSPKVET
jgi:hypothetical protein